MPASPGFLVDDFLARGECGTASANGAGHALQKDRTLILAGLAKEDFYAFHSHRVPYSGSTGGSCSSANYVAGPYIATWMSQFARAIRAIGWKILAVEFAGDQVICRRAAERSLPAPPPDPPNPTSAWTPNRIDDLTQKNKSRTSIQLDLTPKPIPVFDLMCPLCGLNVIRQHVNLGGSWIVRYRHDAYPGLVCDNILKWYMAGIDPRGGISVHEVPAPAKE